MGTASNSVTKQTLYIVAGIAAVVGFMAGVVFSSLQTESYPVAQNNRGPAPQATVQQGGVTPQQASQILALEQRVSTNPADANAWVQLGNTYFDASRFDKAIRAYTKYNELQPGNANVLTDLGVMYRRSGDPQQALANFESAIMADPRHEQSRFNKGIVLMYDLGDIQGAVTTWQELLTINPGAIAGNGTPISEIIADAKSKLPGAGQ
nr:tetratricopeptide repeat protein [Desulfobulbaceae bacterium]